MGAETQVTILAAKKDVYAASIDDRLLMTIGPGSFKLPSTEWQEAASGSRWKVWRRS